MKQEEKSGGHVGDSEGKQESLLLCSVFSVKKAFQDYQLGENVEGT